MFAFLLPIATKIITDAVAKIPDNSEELGERKRQSLYSNS